MFIATAKLHSHPAMVFHRVKRYTPAAGLGVGGDVIQVKAARQVVSFLATPGHGVIAHDENRDTLTRRCWFSFLASQGLTWKIIKRNQVIGS
jgi:hypothetical protein